MEFGLAPDEVAIVAEGDAAFGDDGIEVGKGVEVAVDDGLVEVDQRVSAGCSSGV